MYFKATFSTSQIQTFILSIKEWTFLENIASCIIQHFQKELKVCCSKVGCSKVIIIFEIIMLEIYK